MNHSTRFSLLSLIMLASTTVSAGQADLCYSPPTSAATSGTGTPVNATVFSCPQAGEKTIPQLAAAGWNIVQMMPVMVSSTQQSNQLVIQKP